MVRYEILSLRSAMFAEYTQGEGWLRRKLRTTYTLNHIWSVSQAWHETKSYCSLKQPTWLFYCGAGFGLRH